MKPPKLTKEGRLQMTRSTEAEEFHCGRCGYDKKAKNKAIWRKLDGSDALMCNLCYGIVLQQE